MTVEQTGRRYYYGLDLIRFLCALAVVLFHLGYSAFDKTSRGVGLVVGIAPVSFGGAFRDGFVGVEIFFVISGLVIANSAYGSTAFRFIRSRCERLYPTVWLCAPIGLAVWLIVGDAKRGAGVLTFLKTIVLFPFGQWIDAPYWTLDVRSFSTP